MPPAPPGSSLHSHRLPRLQPVNYWLDFPANAFPARQAIAVRHAPRRPRRLHGRGRPAGVPRPPGGRLALPQAGRLLRRNDQPAKGTDRMAGAPRRRQPQLGPANQARQRHHRETPARGRRPLAGRGGADPLPAARGRHRFLAPHHLRLLAGRLRLWMQVLRLRARRLETRPQRRRDRRPVHPRRPAGGGPLRRRARRQRPVRQHRVHGHGRAASSRKSSSSPTSRSSSASPCRCTAPPTRCASRSCR